MLPTQPVPDRIQLLEERRRLQEQLAWQAVVIFFVAEGAFLTIALDGGRSEGTRVVVAMVAAFAVAVVLHLYVRARYFERVLGSIVNPPLRGHPTALHREAGADNWLVNRVDLSRCFVIKLRVFWLVVLLMLAALVCNVVLGVLAARGWAP